MATLSVLSCKYDGTTIVAELLVEFLDFREFWKLSAHRTRIQSNEITIFSPINNNSFTTHVKFRRRPPFYVEVEQNGNKIEQIAHSSYPMDYVKEFSFVVEALNTEMKMPNSLLADLRKLSDFTFHCKNRDFTVNKAIMQARSPVFMAMGSSNFKEGQENRVNIDDFEPEIIEKMIEFCETDKIEESQGYELGLYKIARKYQIESFMIYTQTLLEFTTTFDNCCELLKLSNTYDDSELTSFLLSWIRPNILHIRKTPGFASLTDEQIAAIFR